MKNRKGTSVSGTVMEEGHGFRAEWDFILRAAKVGGCTLKFLLHIYFINFIFFTLFRQYRYVVTANIFVYFVFYFQ